MYSIITKVTYEYAHRLMYHQGKCRHVHGHSGEVIVELTASTLNDNGFVMDFNDIKTPLKQWINEHWDHAYLANRHDPLLPTLQANGMKVFVFDAEPSAEVMAAFLYWNINKLITRPEVRIKRVTVKETCTGSASYEPTND